MQSQADSLMEVLQEGPVLLYDGECGVCSRSVQWILTHERSDSLRFAALKSPIGQRLAMEAQVPEQIDSLLWVESTENGVVARFWSNAVFATLKYVGGPWRLLSVFRLLPQNWRDFGYRLFAKHRLKVAPSSCLIPPPESRARFLDT